MKHFQAFTIEFTGRVNRIITDLQVSDAFDPKKPPDPLPPSAAVKALWDTGATGSVITEGLAAKLGLTPSGKAQVKHAQGIDERHTYVVNFGLPNHVGVPGVRVSECSPQQDFDAIIGMDIMTLGDFSITNVAGKTVMTFRIPSIKTIDYVADANRFKYRNVGRNSKCPCGSGKKFKKCCESTIRR